jgi:hypothetical protein
MIEQRDRLLDQLAQSERALWLAQWSAIDDLPNAQQHLSTMAEHMVRKTNIVTELRELYERRLKERKA